MSKSNAQILGFSFSLLTGLMFSVIATTKKIDRLEKTVIIRENQAMLIQADLRDVQLKLDRLFHCDANDDCKLVREGVFNYLDMNLWEKER